MKIRIVADSSSDITSMENIDFAIAPLTISTDEESFIDNPQLDVREMQNYLASYKGRSFTACPNIANWLDCFEGADIIYVVTMTSKLSGTYNAAVRAAEIFKEGNPNAEIYVFDTLSTGPEAKMLVEKIAEYVNSGKDFKTVCTLAKLYLNGTKLFFALESFHNLVQNGRMNKSVAYLAEKLGIRVLARASEEGTIETIKKCRGERQLVQSFVECVMNAGYKGGKLYISHCDNEGLAIKISDVIKESYKNAKIAVYSARGLCSYYAKKGGLILGMESE